MASLQNWIAFEELHQPLFREHGAIYFSNSNKPSRDFNYAFCEVNRSLFCSRVCYVLHLPLQPITFSCAAAASFLGNPRASIHSRLQSRLHLRMHTPTSTHVNMHLRMRTLTIFVHFFIRSPVRFLSDVLLPTHTFSTFNSNPTIHLSFPFFIFLSHPLLYNNLINWFACLFLIFECSKLAKFCF